MTAAALVARLALAALAAGAVACKQDATPTSGGASTSSSGGGGGSAGAETSAEVKRLAPRNGALPAAPRRLGDGSLAGADDGADDGERRRGRRGDGPRPDREEMRAMGDQRRLEALEIYDADKSGELDESERAVMHEARIADLVTRLDKDADGRLTKAELEEMATRGRRPPPDFAVIDTDKDGFVTVEEMARSQPARPGGRDRRGPPGGAPPAPPVP